MEEKQVPELAALTYEMRCEELANAGAVLSAARARQVAASQRLRAVVVAAAAEGISELQISRMSGLTRQTVRDWLGK